MGKQTADSMFSKLLAFTLSIILFVVSIFILEKQRTSPQPWVHSLLANWC